MSTTDEISRARAARDLAYAARRVQRVIASGRGGRETWGRWGTCGTAMGGADVDIDRAGDKWLAALPGETCGSTLCAVCGRSIRARRATEIVAAAVAWERLGGRLLMLTVAPPHKHGDGIEVGWERLQDFAGTDRFWAGAPGKRWRARWGVEHTVTAVEATVGGQSGDHPHLHVLLFVAGDEGARVDTDAMASTLLSGFVRWADRTDAERREGAKGWRPPREGERDAQRVGRRARVWSWGTAGIDLVDAGPSAGTYLAKLVGPLDDDQWADATGLGMELTDAGGAKVGRGGSGSVPVTSVTSIIAIQGRDAGRQRIGRSWLIADPRRAAIVAALCKWRMLTVGTPLIRFSKGLRALIPDIEEMSDRDAVAHARRLRHDDAERRRVARQGDEAAPAEVAGGPFDGLADGPEETEAPDPLRPALSISADLWRYAEQAWGGEWGGAEAYVCRGVERVGTWRVLGALCAAAEDAGRPNVWRHGGTGRVRIGFDAEWHGPRAVLGEPDERWGPMTWAEVTTADNTLAA